MILHLEFSVTFFKCDYAKLHLKTPNYSTFCVNTAFRKMANIYALKHQNTLIFFIHRLFNKSTMLHNNNDLKITIKTMKVSSFNLKF